MGRQTELGWLPLKEWQSHTAEGDRGNSPYLRFTIAPPLLSPHSVNLKANSNITTCSFLIRRSSCCICSLQSSLLKVSSVRNIAIHWVHSKVVYPSLYKGFFKERRCSGQMLYLPGISQEFPYAPSNLLTFIEEILGNFPMQSLVKMWHLFKLHPLGLIAELANGCVLLKKCSTPTINQGLCLWGWRCKEQCSICPLPLGAASVRHIEKALSICSNK